ncbi:MAG: patatin-like phospholipase family protein, partial [Blastocatellia bacterium]
MQYDLIFKGGGAKGSVFVGALEEFYRQGHSFRRCVGTSAGSITATLLVAGYTPEEMLSAVTEKMIDGKPRFASFMDVSPGFTSLEIENSLTSRLFNEISLNSFINSSLLSGLERKLVNHIINELMKSSIYREIFSLTELGGLFAGDKFLEWIKEKLSIKSASYSEITFGDFYKATGQDLTVVASDLTSESILVINHRTAPNCPVSWGVRMSMSIPFIWQDVIWQSDWGLYCGQNITEHSIVDGGVLSNFPIELIASRDEDVIKLMGQASEIPYIGMYIDETLYVEGSGNQPRQQTTIEDG